MKKLAELKRGARFTYAGVEWVKLDDTDGGALALAAEPVFERAFDDGTATDKIALISDGLYRKFRALIPKIGCWWWTLTPWTCDPEYSCSVRNVYSSGAVDWNYAYRGHHGVRPLCNMKSDILVSVPGEENADDQAESRAAAVEEAAEAVMETLGDYAVSLWGDVLAAVVSSLFKSKQDAEEIMQEEEAKRAAEG